MTQKDALGTRMKQQYESRAQTHLPRRTYTIVRVDGRAFHTYCRGLARPFDEGLMNAMDAVAVALCAELQGARFAYVQSDEVSVLLTDFEKDGTEAAFDGNVQKITSISASIAAVAFNRRRAMQSDCDGYGVVGQQAVPFTWAQFDARAFTIPDPTEVANYFIWRQADATRNSISMAAQAQFPHDLLHGLSSKQLQELLFTEADINWDEYPVEFKRGRTVTPDVFDMEVAYTDKRTGEAKMIEARRRGWKVQDPPIFTGDVAYLRNLIPVYS